MPYSRRPPLIKAGALELEQATLTGTIKEGTVTPAPPLFDFTKSPVEFQVNFHQDIYGLDTKVLFEEFQACNATLSYRIRQTCETHLAPFTQRFPKLLGTYSLAQYLVEKALQQAISQFYGITK